MTATQVEPVIVIEACNALRSLVNLSRDEYRGIGRPYGNTWQRADSAYRALEAALLGAGATLEAGPPARPDSLRKPNAGRPV